MNQRRAALGAAVAMFAAAVVGIGVLAGGSGDGLPKLPLGGGAGDGAAMTAARSEAGADPAVSDMAFGGGGVEYRVEGELPDLPDEATAYEMSGGVTTQQVEALADRLGVQGAVTAEGDHAYVVTDGDRQLRVDRFAGAQWYLGPYFASDCPVSSSPVGSDDEIKAREMDCAAASASGGSGSGAGSEPGSESGSVGGQSGRSEPGAPPDEECPMPDCPPDAACMQACPTPDGEPMPTEPWPMPEPMPLPEPERPADLPSKAEATAIAERWFADLGVDHERLTVYDGFSEWHVNAETVIDGLPVFGLGSSVNVGPKGEVISASGFLGVAEALGDYPLVTVAKGVERLRTNFPYGHGDITLDARPLIAEDCPPDAMCSPVEHAEPVVRTIVGARLGLMWQGPLTDGGGAHLLPAFHFEIAEDAHEGQPAYHPVIAVTDEHVEIPEPMPAGDGGTDIGRPEPAIDPAVSGPAEE